MRTSKYNIKKRLNDKEWILYNSLSNTLAVIENKQMDLLESKNYDELIKVDNDLSKKLVRGGYVIEDDFDENVFLDYKLQESRYDKTVLALTIAPTLDCNFRCSYCYEKNKYKNIVMTNDTAHSIVEFVAARANTLSELLITWYGGEPLLALNVVEKISNELRDICEKNNIAFDFTIVTNGFLLTKKNAERLQRIGIKTVQITLDGTEEKHNEKRPLKNGGATFKTIINNLVEVTKYFDEIYIRVNCDEENMDDYKNLYFYIKSLNIEKIIMYAAPIRDYEGCYSCGKCFVKKSFKEKEYDIYKSFGEKDFEKFIRRKYPTVTWNACGADSVNSIVVSADGDLYKCWSDIGNHERSFGNINKIEDLNVMNQIFYFKNPKDNAECYECRMYPICLGGCPYERSIGKTDVCEYSEEILVKYLEGIINGQKSGDVS